MCINNKLINIFRPLGDVVNSSTYSYRPNIGKTKIKTAIEPNEEEIKMFEKLDSLKLDSKEYRIWLKWWKEHYSSNDYFKFLSTKVIFMQYLTVDK